jgi:cysteine desulfurase
MAYLDHAASTPVRAEALAAMVEHLAGPGANPSGGHGLARRARVALDDAREDLAEVLGAAPGEVVFTSGGTEADNLAVLGTHDRRAGVVVCAATEHHAVLEPVRARRGRTVAVDDEGVIDLDALATALDGDVTLVSVMLVNNEVGTVQPLAAVGEIVAELAPRAAFHTDAVQALTWLDLARAAAPADLVSISAHKFGGPPGVGALVVRGGASVAARQIGGGQERERRSGTPDLPGIVGMAVAARLARDERAATVERVTKMRDRLAEGLLASVPGARVIGTGADRVGGMCALTIVGVESEALLYLLDQTEVYASAGSSCASGALEPSHVLSAMGVSRVEARGALRLSLGAASTDADIDAALAAVPAAVTRLREVR